MLVYCCVRGCKNNSNTESKNITFHEFPSELALRKKWLQAIGRPQWDPPNHIRICSGHFSLDQLNEGGSEIWIKEEAYSLDTLEKPFNESSNVEVCRICLVTDVKMFSLKSGTLKSCKETIAKLNDNDNTEDLPHFVCFECGAQLLKHHRLIEKSIIAQTILLEILEENGRITKPLVREKDRRQFKLHSTLGYPEPDAIIAIANYNGGSKTNLDDSDSFAVENSCSNFERSKSEELKRPRKRNLEMKPKRKKNINASKARKNNTKDRKNGVKSRNVKIDDKSQNVTEHNTIENVEMNISFKSEAVDHYEHNNVQNCNTVSETNQINHANNTFKIEFERLPDYKVEKLDSEPEMFRDDLKHQFHHKTEGSVAENNKSDDRTENINVKNKSNKKINTRSLTEELEIKTTCNDSDDALENVSDCESSDSIDLWTLKNNVKHKKLEQNDNLVRKKRTPRKKKSGDKEPAGESAIGKLKCYKIVNLTLQEQIIEWRKENEESIHSRDQVFQCEVCTKKFLRKKAYEQHLSYHKPSRGDVECPVCMERFQTKIRLNAHTIRTHAKKYECTKCPKVLYNLIRAKRHEIQHSGQVYKCPHCAYSTRHRSAAWEHVRTQHAHAHHCAACGHGFINAKGLAQHRAIAHPEQEEVSDPHPCEQCNIVFHSEGALRVHQFTSKLHENEESQPPAAAEGQAPKVSCKKCGATFLRRRELWAHAQQQHQWVYRPTLRTRGVPLDLPTCEHCDKELKNRFEYWCHLRREHPNLKHTFRRVVTAVCEKCGKGFNNPSLLKVHELSHGTAKFACATCPRVFHDRYALARHAYSHTPDRPHACTECGRAFKLKGNLDRHMRTHTGETPYECSFCGKKFKYWSSMNEHEKHSHKKIPWPPRDRRPGAKKGAPH